jgi:hypothetical protein
MAHALRRHALLSAAAAVAAASAGAMAAESKQAAAPAPPPDAAGCAEVACRSRGDMFAAMRRVAPAPGGAPAAAASHRPQEQGARCAADSASQRGSAVRQQRC